MTTWNDVTVAIPTVVEREASAARLVADLARKCPEAKVVLHRHVPGEPAWVTFPTTLMRAGVVGHLTRRPWVLQLEDDVDLAPDFGRLALEVGLDDCDVLTLFSRSRRDLAAMDRGEKVRRLNPSAFSMSQGFFIRREMAVGVHVFAPSWYADHPQHNRAADLLLADYLSTVCARVLVRVPSLVQHRRGPSTLPGHHGARQSESYRRAFGEAS